MNKLNRLAQALIVAGLGCGLLATAQAQTYTEQEVNSTITQSQLLTATSSTVVVNGSLGTLDDLDFYYFYANAGDVVTLNIDGAAKLGTGDFDSILTLFQSVAGFPIQAMNDDASMDAGSIATTDSRIDNFVIPVSGNYVVAVSAYPRYFIDGGDAAPGDPSPLTNGTYTLTITGLTQQVQSTTTATATPAVDTTTATTSTSTTTTSPTTTTTSPTTTTTSPTTTTTTTSPTTTTTSPTTTTASPTTTTTSPTTTTAPQPSVQHISIEVKPGSRALTRLNSTARASIPVVLLSSRTFNALSVDTTSLTFGSTGDEHSLSRCNPTRQDVNRDGRADLVCHFENHLASFQKGDLMATLRGRTLAGQAFEGQGLLKVHPEKRDASRQQRRHYDHNQKPNQNRR